MEDVPFLDEDSEDSFGFEIGIDKANKQRMRVKRFNQDDSDDSFDARPMEDDERNDFMNSTGKRKIATAVGGTKAANGSSAHKRNIIAQSGNNQNQFMN